MQKRIWCDDCGDRAQPLMPQAVRPHGQSSSVIVSQPETSAL